MTFVGHYHDISFGHILDVLFGHILVVLFGLFQQHRTFYLFFNVLKHD